MTVVTFRPSRAIVQRACNVYMPLPSADRHKTRRSGHATAAPTASGIAIPIEPPVFASQSWGPTPAVASIKPLPEVIDSSTTIVLSGSTAPIADDNPGIVIGPAGAGGREFSCPRELGFVRGAPIPSATAFSAPR